MNRFTSVSMTIFCTFLLLTGVVFAGSDMAGHDMTKSDAASDRIGELFHESMKDGYMLSYYLMDLREQKKTKSVAAHGKMEMDKPHHIMVYITDKDNKPVLKGKVGFMITNHSGSKQKAMGMFMSNGFGTTADMREKGVYTITTKALVKDVTLMDSFDYEIK